MQLYPHILLRTDAESSACATVLRTAGYVVTKVRDDERLETLAAGSHVDAIVVELPLIQEIATARRTRSIDLPILFLTRTPQALRNVAEEIATLAPRHVADELVTTIDLLIARHPRTVRSAARAVA